MMTIEELTQEKLITINKNWRMGIKPKECKGICNLVEGGGELVCHACGWTEGEEYVEPIRNA